jgi:hypothetical protein
VLDDTPEDVIAAVLHSQEKLLWAGRPPLGIRFCWADLFHIPFTVLWCAGAVAGETIFIVFAVQGRATLVAALVPLPFVIMGAYITVGRFMFDAKARARTYYVVTSERVIIILGLFWRKVKSFDLDTLSQVTLREKRDGSGMIQFGCKTFWDYYRTFGHSWGDRCSWPGKSWHQMPHFELASDARQTYELIESLRAAKQGEPETLPDRRDQ